MHYSMTEVILTSLLIQGIGPPWPQAAYKCPFARRSHRCLPFTHLHGICHSIQCTDLPAGSGPTHQLLYPHPIFLDSEATRSDPSIWSVQDGQMGSSYQHIRAVLSRLRRHLDAVPSITSSRQGQYELCRTNLWSCSHRRLRTLVHSWVQDVPDTYQQV